MKDFDTMKGFDFDACPVHGVDLAKEYDFGMQDARVYKFECGCCACTIGDALDDDGTYHTDYASAAGRARLGSAIAAVKYRD